MHRYTELLVFVFLIVTFCQICQDNDVTRIIQQLNGFLFLPF